MSTSTSTFSLAVAPALNSVSAESPLSVADACLLTDSDKLVLLEALLRGELQVRGGNVVPPTARQTGPRGPSEKVVSRRDAAAAALIELAGRPGGCNTTDLLDYSHTLPRVDGRKAFEYQDIGAVAELLVSTGVITETVKGRARTWTRVTAEV